METITVNFTEDEKHQMDVKAKECGMTVEELIHLSATSTASAGAEDFEDIKAYLLEKYGNVYRSLA